MYKMGTNYFNWVEDNTHKAQTKEAQKKLNDFKRDQQNKKFQLVKVSDHPLTYKEVEVKS